MEHLPASESSSSSSPSSDLTPVGRRPSGRPKINSYTDLMKPGESWEDLPDATERRKIQNRLAQRAYRRNMRDRTKEVELLKSQVQKLQQAINTKTSGGVESDERQARAPSHDSSVNGGSGGSGSTYFDKWPDVMTPEHEMLGDCIQWPTDLSQELGDCFDKTSDAGPAAAAAAAAVSNPSVSPIMSGTSSTDGAPHTISWSSSEPGDGGFFWHGEDDGSVGSNLVGYPQPPPSPPSTDDIRGAHSSSILSSGVLADGQRLAQTASPSSDRDPDADEPLIHLAISRGTINTLSLLLETYPLSVNLRDKAGYTPLQRAVIHGRTDMMALLIKSGADAA